MVVFAANDMAASTAFYAKVFGWRLMRLNDEVTSAMIAAGPPVTLRADTPAGFQATVPFIGVRNVEATLERILDAGGAVERAPWQAPMIGTLARFTDPAGTIYGLSSSPVAAATPSIPAPFGDAPKPPNGTVCSLEMHAGDLAVAGQFFETLFGWGSIDTMPQYRMFNPGGGIGGVFQAHTPATRALAYLYASDVGATLTALEAAGGKRMSDPMPVPGMGTFGYFTDPSGTPVGLIGA